MSALLARLRIDPYLLLLIGTVVLASIFPAHGIGADIMTYAVYAAVALLFFLYGAKLAPSAILSGLTHWRLQGLVFLSTFVLFPIIGLILTTLLRPWLPADLALGLMFVCVLPSTVQSSIAFTSIARGNVPAALCSATVSNLAGMVLTPTLVALLLSAHGTGFSTKALVDVAVQLLLPFGLGQAARPWLAPVLARHKTLTSYVDRGSILLVVFAAFSEGVVAGIWSHVDYWSLGLVIVLDIVLLALVLVTTTMVARLVGFATEDEIVLVFCGSKKSLASGIPMANILFPGAAIGLVVLPLMLFHQVQLFACATLAQRYAARKGAAAERVAAVQAEAAISAATIPDATTRPA
jgi:sodium/bile acid cotransporter 7